MDIDKHGCIYIYIAICYLYGNDQLAYSYVCISGSSLSECTVNGEECCSPFYIMQLKIAINNYVGDFATKVQGAVTVLNQKTKGTYLRIAACIHICIHSYMLYT